ncbi:sugar transferase [Anaerostipes sp.]|uniref:sugar transferase n=1 Tax=Anaerostipes sp. TaxID=1872530 RepID=UPI003967C179
MGVSKRQMQNFLIYVLDMVGLTAGYFVAVYLRFGNLKTAYGFMRVDTYLRWITAMAVLTFVYLLFHPNRSFFKRKIKDEIRCDFQTAVLTGAGMSMIALLMADASEYSRFIYMFTIGFEFFYMIIVHRLYRKYWLRRRSNHSFARKMMLITTSGEAEQVITNIIKEKIWDLWITSIVIIDKDMVGENVCGIPVIGFTYRSMFEYAARNVVDEVFIYIPKEYKYPVAMTIQNFEDMGINTSLNIPLFQINQNLNKTLETVGPYNVVSFSGREVSLFMLLLKRAMDILGGLVGLLITGIALIFVAPAVKLESPGPLLFSQKRVGRNGRIFKIYKIRSMYQDAEERKKELMAQNEMDGLMFKMKDDPRITKVGKFIRKTSIDELPQFWNVLKGDMSLVGTRPPTVDEFEQYSAYHKKRLCRTPGLTGIWQVSGRSTITDFEEIVKLDVQYIENWSLWLDIKILFKTVALVFKGDDGAQ